MPTLTWEGQSIPVAPGESALDALLGAGVSVPHSCRAGACQSCLVNASAGTIPPSAQQGLKPALIAQGYLLACLCCQMGNHDSSLEWLSKAFERGDRKKLKAEALTDADLAPLAAKIDNL